MAVTISKDLENKLLDKAVKGDRQAFDQLISHYLAYMHNIAAKFTDYKEDTEEAVQEALIKIWVNLPKFKREARLSTWVYIITLNCSRNNLSSRHKIPTHPHNQQVIYDQVHAEGDNENLIPVEEDQHHTFGVDHASPEDELLADQVGDVIFMLAETMSPILYETWYMREVELLSYIEISDRKGIPIGTCKSQLFNARNKLDELVKEYLCIDDSNERFEIAG